MGPHERASWERQDQEEERRRPRRREVSSGLGRLHVQDEGRVPIGPTPFHPPSDLHAAMLFKAPSGVARRDIVLQLQRTYGNSYVQGLLSLETVRSNLVISDPDHVYEEEARGVARTVAGAMNAEVERQPEEVEGLREDLLAQPVESRDAAPCKNLEMGINSQPRALEPALPEAGQQAVVVQRAPVGPGTMDAWRTIPSPGWIAPGTLEFASTSKGKVGSIYFEDGRIRLRHPAGPAVEHHESIERFVVDAADWDLVWDHWEAHGDAPALYGYTIGLDSAEEAAAGSPGNLVEFFGKGSEGWHPSRGSPEPFNYGLEQPHFNVLYHAAKTGDNDTLANAMHADPALSKIPIAPP